MRTLFFVTLVTAVSLLFAQFFLGPGPTHNIQMNVTANREADGIRISGSTNLSDSAILELHLSGSSYTQLHRRATVDDGRFEAFFPIGETDVPDIPDADLALTVVFEIVMTDRLQEGEIVRRYGGFGEHLAGPHVFKDDRGTHLKYSIPVAW